MLDELQTRQCWFVVTYELMGVDINILTVFARHTVQICCFSCENSFEVECCLMLM